MSIWRAPLLILGVLLILLAAGAAALPWLVDFNRYKPQLQRWATQLAGREVRIGGDVRLALFPWPSARLREVSVAGVAGGRHADLLRVREVRARLSLAALLGGRLEVEHITLLRPVLMLEHLGSGRGNWTLTPHGGLRLPFSGERIRIDSVRVENGQVLLADHRLRRELRIDDIDATLSAPALRGPWRLAGTWRLLERTWQVRAATGMAEPGQPLSISLRMEPPEGKGGHLLRLEGDLIPARSNGRRARLEGELTLQPVLASGRGDPLDPARQVEMTGKLRVDADMLELAEVEITPRLGAASPFDTLRGNLRLALGTVLNAELSLRARKLALNRPLARLLGLGEAMNAAQASEGMHALRRHLRAVARRLSDLPPELLLELDLQATEMRVEGRVFHGVAMSAEVSPELLAVHHLRADAPGKASLSFKGSLLGGNLLQLTGELDARSADARALLTAIAPDAGAALSPLWRGRGGKLRLLATLDLTDQTLRLVSRELSLDDAPLRLDWRLHEPDGGKGARHYMLRLTAERFNADRYLGAAGMGELLNMLARTMRQAAAAGGAQVELHLRAADMRLAGRHWRGVALALQRQDGEIALRELKVADLAGLSLDGSGQLRRLAAGWRGGVKMRLRGADSEAVQRLLAQATGGGKRIGWLKSAGAVNVQAMLHAGVNTEDGGQPTAGRWLEAALDGHVGKARLSLSARGALPDAKGGAAQGAKAWNWREADWRAQGELRNMPAPALLGLLGLRADLPPGAGTLRLRAQGIPARKLRGGLELTLPGTELSAQGWAALPKEVAKGTSTWPPLQGEVKLELALDDAGAWARLADMALPTGAPLKGIARLAFSPQGWKLSKMALQSGGNRIAGELSMRRAPASTVAEAEGSTPLLRGNLVADVLNPALVLTTLLGEVDAPARWRRDLAGGRALNIVLRADSARLPGWGLELPSAKLELKHDGADAMRVAFHAGVAGRMLRAQAMLHHAEATLLTDGDLRAELPLHDILRTADGTVRLAGAAEVMLKAQGRSATVNGWLAALRGEGMLRARQVRLLGISPLRLVALARGITTQEDLARFEDKARVALLTGEWPLPAPLQMKLKLAGGLLEAAPLRWQQEGLETATSALMDVATRKLDVALHFTPRGKDAPPPFEVALAGAPGALTLSADWAGLRDWAQQRLLQRQEEELKRLEEERARREALARRLEEEAARAVREQEQQEELRHQAGQLREQLQDVLSRAYQQMHMRQQPAAHTESATTTPAPTTSASPAPPAETSSERKTLDVLIRQALEDDQLDETATTPAHRLPLEAQAHPRALGLPPPRPRARPHPPARRTAPPRRKPPVKTTRNGNGRGQPVGTRKKATARQPAGTPKESAAKTVAKAPAQNAPAPLAKSTPARQKQKPRRRISPPLTNWNRLAPASP